MYASEKMTTAAKYDNTITKLKTPEGKEGDTMPTERESNDAKKAMAYDLLRVIESGEKEHYSKEEIKEIVNAYITGLTQK